MPATSGGLCSAALADGRSLITGGGEAPLATTQYFGPGGSTTPVESMIEGRRSHVCVALSDNTVLVAGGIGGTNEPTNTAEVFDIETGRWKLTGPLLAPRAGASAIQIADGRVLVIGGQIDGEVTNTLEMYNPGPGRFEPVAGNLSVPREEHAVVSLEDGRILIAGGKGPDGEVLDSTDIFDPVIGNVLPGPRMLAPRANFTATLLLDGRVLLAGGSDGTGELASAEIFDPETNRFSATTPMRAARQGQVAVALRDNERVLIAGGFAAGEPVEQAELYIPWRGEFEPFPPNAAGSSGVVMIVGLLDPEGKLVSTGTYTSPTVVVNGRSSEAGEMLAVTGAGWQPDQEVRLQQPGGEETTTVADSSGRIVATLGCGSNSIGGYITITPSDTSEVGVPHTFTITVTQRPDGAAPAGTANISYSLSASPDFESSTCGPAIAFAGNVATCTVTINNNSPGTFTVNASAGFSIDGAFVSVSTDGTGSNSGPAVKEASTTATYVVARGATGEAAARWQPPDSR